MVAQGVRHSSILSLREEQILLNKLAKARAAQLKDLDNDTLLDDFLHCFATQQEIVAYQNGSNSIRWVYGQGFLVELDESFFKDPIEMSLAYRGVRAHFFEAFVSEEDSSLPVVEQSPAVIPQVDSVLAEIQEEEIDSTPEPSEEEIESFIDSEEQEESIESVSEETEVDDTAEELDSVEEALEPEDTQELEEEAVEGQEESSEQEDSQTEDVVVEQEASQEEDDGEEEDLLGKVGDLDANTLSGDEEEVHADEFSNLSHPDDAQEDEEVVDEPEEPEEDLLGKVGELDANTLSGEDEEVHADEFSNLAHPDDVQEEEEASQEPEEEEDLLGKVGELDANTLSGEDEEVHADEFSNLAPSDDASDEPEEEPEDDGGMMDQDAIAAMVASENSKKEEPKAAEEEPEDDGGMMDQDAIAAMVAAESGKKENPLETKLKSLEEEMVTLGMDKAKIDALLAAVRSGKAPVDMVEQTVEKLKAQE